MILDNMVGKAVDNTQHTFNSQSSICAAGPINASFDSPLQSEVSSQNL
jgi:hypothetical protein